MKNKILLFSAIPAMLLGLSGCNNSSSRFPVQRQLGITEPVVLSTYNEVNDMIATSQSFVLTTYSDCGCLSNDQFYSRMWNSTIAQYNLKVYKIIYTQFSMVAGISFKLDTPDIVIFKKGKVVAHIGAYDAWLSQTSNRSKMISWLEKYVYLDTPMIYITIDELRRKISEHENFLVYYTLSTCPDCLTFNELYLDNWQMNPENKDKVIYVIETTPYRNDWTTFAKEFQMDSESNSLGYLNGKVPSLQYYSNGALSANAVFFNDVMTTNDTDDSIVISDGYYDEFNNQTFKNKIEYRSKTLSFYSQKFNDLLANLYK